MKSRFTLVFALFFAQFASANSQVPLTFQASLRAEVQQQTQYLNQRLTDIDWVIDQLDSARISAKGVQVGCTLVAVGLITILSVGAAAVLEGAGYVGFAIFVGSTPLSVFVGVEQTVAKGAAADQQFHASATELGFKPEAWEAPALSVGNDGQWTLSSSLLLPEGPRRKIWVKAPTPVLAVQGLSQTMGMIRSAIAAESEKMRAKISDRTFYDMGASEISHVELSLAEQRATRKVIESELEALAAISDSH